MSQDNVRSSSSSTTSADEKARINQLERANIHGDEREKSKPYNAQLDVSGVDEKKLLRKLDWYLVPWLSFLYLLSFLDRTSIGNAKVRRPMSTGMSLLTVAQLYGLEKSLNIDDNQYNIALTIFFFSYALFEVSVSDIALDKALTARNCQVPSNVFLKRLRPSIWLSLLMLLWGIMMVRPL